MIEFLKYYDQLLHKKLNKKDRDKKLIFLFLTECKYNLDILASINFEDHASDESQLRKIIKLLSITVIEKIYFEDDKNIEGSILFDIAKKLGGTLNKIFFNGVGDMESISDNLIQNLYKRILVLKSLSEIEPPYSSLKNLNYKLRLKNLNKVLLKVVEKYSDTLKS